MFICSRCGRCCEQVVDVNIDDIVRISTKLNTDVRDFYRRYLSASTEVPSFVLEPKNGKCPFYSDGCSIYEVRPRACRMYPFYTPIVAYDTCAWKPTRASDLVMPTDSQFLHEVVEAMAFAEYTAKYRAKYGHKLYPRPLNDFCDQAERDLSDSNKSITRITRFALMWREQMDKKYGIES